VIVVCAGAIGDPAARLLALVAARGHTLVRSPEALPPGDAPVVLAVSDGPSVFDYLAAVQQLDPHPFRTLMLSRLGAHPDARAASLQRLWRLEEHVRAGNAPVLTLRLAPLVGPETPLWRRLRSRPALPNGGRKLLNPVAERDAVETIIRALDGRAKWEGWYEVAGPDAVTLAELRDLAANSPSDIPRGDAGEWEPPLEEMMEHRLAEAEPWASHFGIVPTPPAG
jgi:uncharacterized protein YbjT (DUF2867 family)